MKNKEFLIKIIKKKKIEFVEPSENVKDSYIEKSESNLISAKILLENDRLEESMSLSYYSMYHMLTALLFKIGIKCENHSASIILLKDLFGIDNKDIFSAKKERIDKQYYVTTEKDDITKEVAEELLNNAEDFVLKIKVVIKNLNNDSIEEIRDKFVSI